MQKKTVNYPVVSSCGNRISTQRCENVEQHVGIYRPMGKQTPCRVRVKWKGEGPRALQTVLQNLLQMLLQVLSSSGDPWILHRLCSLGSLADSNSILPGQCDNVLQSMFPLTASSFYTNNHVYCMGL